MNSLISNLDLFPSSFFSPPSFFQFREPLRCLIEWNLDPLNVFTQSINHSFIFFFCLSEKKNQEWGNTVDVFCCFRFMRRIMNKWKQWKQGGRSPEEWIDFEFALLAGVDGWVDE